MVRAVNPLLHLAVKELTLNIVQCFPVVEIVHLPVYGLIQRPLGIDPHPQLFAFTNAMEAMARHPVVMVRRRFERFMLLVALNRIDEFFV
jgi:hypothetical protein